MGCTLGWWDSSEAVSILQTLFEEFKVEKLSASRKSAKEDLSEVASTLNKDLKFIHSGTIITIILHS